MSEIAVSVIIVLIFFLSPLILSIRAFVKLKRIPILEEEIQFLKKEILSLKESSAFIKSGDLTIAREIHNTDSVEVQPSNESSVYSDDPVVPDDLPIQELPLQNVKPKPIFKKSNKRSRRKWNQERAFAFLGGFLGIIGLVFLTMYLGTIIGIFFRFMIMTGFSTLLLVISFPLGKREKWEELSHISRSFSGALFLFAVFASSTIEGLKWIENPLLSLTVISAGTIYNLILGGLCRKKGYMIFHMAINFLVVFLLPAEPLVFWLAFLLTMGLQVFGFVRKEQLNSGLSFLLFTFFAVFYKETAADFLYFSWCFNFAALLSFVNFTLFDKEDTLLRKVISFALPVLWIGTAAYLGESKIEAVIPLLTAILAGSLVRIGKSRNYKKLLFWPFQILVTGVLLILASGEGTQYWLVLLYLESCYFCYWMIKESEYKSAPLLLNYLILISTVAYSCLSENLTINVFTVANRIVLVGAASFFMLKGAEKNEGKSADYYTLANIFQIMLPLFAFFLSINSKNPGTLESVSFYTILALLLFFISNNAVLKIRTYGLWAVSLIPLFFIVIQFIGEPQTGFLNSLILLLPLLLLSLILLVWNKIRKTEFTTDLGVYLFTLILIVFFYFPFRQISTILPGVLILLSSFVYYFRWELQTDREMQISGTVLLVLFFIRHITHNLQLEESLWIFSFRLLIEITSLPVLFLYLKSKRWDAKLGWGQSTVFILSWLMVLVMIFSHSNRNILSMVFQLSIVILLFVDRKKYLEGYPLVSLAYIHFIFAQLNLTLNTHPSFPFLPGFLQNPWIFGLINLGTSVSVIYLFFRHTQEVDFFVYPLFSRMKKITQKIFEKKNLTLLIPLFISLGLFFNWTLEETALTIALFSGCFILYGTALILRENVFRHATSLALLGTSVRLIFWDLAQSTMLAKSIAFLGASFIFIVINILYSQFKGRFENV